METTAQPTTPTPKPQPKGKVVAAITVILTEDQKIKVSLFPKDNKELITDMIFNAFTNMEFKHVCFDAVIRETQIIEENLEQREKIVTPHTKIITEKDRNLN